MDTPAFNWLREFSLAVLGVPYAASPVFVYISSKFS
jgi:hypothetical protein